MTTADVKATQEAKELLEYLKNTAGQQIITGQHTQTIPCEEIAYIRQTTGKEPKLRGFELLGYSPNINYADASPEYLPTDYADAYEKLVAATSRGKVAALAEVGYLPDVDLLQKSRIPWAYYMTWSKEFCIGEKYNSVKNLKKMYDSEYAVTL